MAFWNYLSFPKLNVSFGSSSTSMGVANWEELILLYTTTVLILCMDESLKQKITQILHDKNPLDADALFEDLSVVPGIVWNMPSGAPINPYERLRAYETRLKEIYDWDTEKYFYIHKGTPFYFCGILSFEVEAYDRAAFYFDAALSEDLKNKPQNYDEFAAHAFYTLNNTYANPVVQYPVNKLRPKINDLINEYNSLFTNNTLTLDFIIENFLKKKLNEKEYRSIIPAFYVFITESERRLFQLKVRSGIGGSIEPFILHLFSGCLIFETLLRQIYSSHSSSLGLGVILQDPFVKQDLGYYTNGQNLIKFTGGVRKTLQDIINHILPYLNGKDPVDRCFTITYALRNVTAHTLSWPDIFTSKNYEDLYKSVTFSILYLISKKF